MDENSITFKSPEFSEFFSTFFSLLPSIGDYICEVFDQNYEKNNILYDIIKENIYMQCEEEFKSVLGPSHEDWIKRNTTYLHCLIVTYCSYADERFQTLSEDDKNILLWASLLHDINKRGKEHFLGPDRVHPFRCGGTTLKIFCRNNFIPQELHEKTNEVAELTFNAVKMLDDEEKRQKAIQENRCTEMHDHSKLPDLFEKLEEFLISPLLLHSDFVRKVFSLVFFHQSIHGIKRFKPTAVLSDEDIVKFVPKDTLHLLEILMNSDSLSRSIISNKSSIAIQENLQYCKEIITEISRIKLMYEDN